jgi:hypothetical protein
MTEAKLTPSGPPAGCGKAAAGAFLIDRPGLGAAEAQVDGI